MPNWVKNRITFDSEEDLKKCFELLKHPEAVEKQEFSYQWVVPYPETKEECIKKFGEHCVTEDPEKDHIETEADKPWLNWYNFNNTAWGCKWDASEVFISGSCIYFDSPWSPPTIFVHALAEKLEEIPFVFAYAEEQGNIYCGEFYHYYGCKGDDWNEFGEGSNEASEMYNDLWGDTYFICEDGEYHSECEDGTFFDASDNLHYFDFTDFSDKNKELAKQLHEELGYDFDEQCDAAYNYIAKNEERAKEADLLLNFLKETIGYYKPSWDDEDADPSEYETDHEYCFVTSFDEGQYAESF